ncbi:MAG: ferredoxin [Actinobacteria bacterium]|nr:ferredoxin [Actinomycetota bacterium]
MKLKIDSGLCEGHGRCWDLLPELVDADDHGHGFLIDIHASVPPELEQKAQEAVRACPERAVTIE